MARSKRAGDAIKEEVKLELTPMIDVTFLILIFFMCTLKFKTLEGKLVSYLPTDKGLSQAQAVIEEEDAEIILRVPPSEWQKTNPLEREVVFMRHGSNDPFGKLVKVEQDPREPKNVSYVLDPPDTLEKVRKYLEDVRKQSPESKAKINAYARTAHLHVVFVLNMMIEVGYTDISYSGIPASLIKDLTSGELK